MVWPQGGDIIRAFGAISSGLTRDGPHEGLNTLTKWKFVCQLTEGVVKVPTTHVAEGVTAIARKAQVVGALDGAESWRPIRASEEGGMSGLAPGEQELREFVNEVSAVISKPIMQGKSEKGKGKGKKKEKNGQPRNSWNW